MYVIYGEEIFSLYIELCLVCYELPGLTLENCDL